MKASKIELTYANMVKCQKYIDEQKKLLKKGIWSMVPIDLEICQKEQNFKATYVYSKSMKTFDRDSWGPQLCL